ncbi:MAG: ATP-binding cassette domain-containing protein [Acholeplasmataceae bacterium]|nr:ATP-binding cassette domain-containing protein [Acholeplasmataceae bacterium]
MEILRTKDLTKNYKSQIAVNKVNMVINEGDIYGFIGENGAGKTTLIRMVSGLIKQTSGEYSLFENGTLNHSSTSHIGAVVETPSLYLNMTAMDNLKAQAYIIGLKGDLNKKFIDSLNLVGLSEVIDSKKTVKNFSLGMKQRLSIALTLLSDPKFLLLDEPMNGLDPEGIVSMRNLIINLNEKRGITFLISSHILDELSRVATRYGFIHKGVLIKEISKEELMSQGKKHTVIVVDKPEETLQVLKMMGLEQVEVEGHAVKVYDEIMISDVVLSLSQKGIKVTNIIQKEKTIEEFYLELMGGEV